MRTLRYRIWLTTMVAVAFLAQPPEATAQNQVSQAEQAARMARRGGGFRVGVWNIDEPTTDSVETSLHFEGYFQRGIDRHIALENSIAVFRTLSTATSTLGGTVETRSYVLPVLTALKFYPLTTVDDKVDPYIMAGGGFVLGIEDEGANAVGGGGTTIVTGFGFRAGVGVELHLGTALGLLAGAKYQWVNFGGDLGPLSTFRGVGFDGGMTYRFQF